MCCIYFTLAFSLWAFNIFLSHLIVYNKQWEKYKAINYPWTRTFPNVVIWAGSPFQEKSLNFPIEMSNYLQFLTRAVVFLSFLKSIDRVLSRPHVQTCGTWQEPQTCTVYFVDYTEFFSSWLISKEDLYVKWMHLHD